MYLPTLLVKERQGTWSELWPAKCKYFSRKILPTRAQMLAYRMKTNVLGIVVNGLDFTVCRAIHTPRRSQDMVEN